MTKKKVLISSALMLAALIPQVAMAAPTGVGDMFANFTGSSEALIRLVKYSGYIIGLFFVISSVFKFAQLGGNNPQASLKVPLTMFFVGVSVFSLTGAVSVVSQTLAMGAGPGSVIMPVNTFNAQSEAAIKGVLTFIRLIGYIAFIRGWMLLNAAAQREGQGLIGRGLTHIFGGVAAINVQIAAQILANSFAPGVPIPGITY